MGLMVSTVLYLMALELFFVRAAALRVVISGMGGRDLLMLKKPNFAGYWVKLKPLGPTNILLKNLF